MEEIGGGAYGVVFRARDRRKLEIFEKKIILVLLKKILLLKNEEKLKRREANLRDKKSNFLFTRRSFASPLCSFFFSTKFKSMTTGLLR